MCLGRVSPAGKKIYEGGSKSFRSDIEKPRRMENSIAPSMVRLMYQYVLK
jgi:hypothetical protein